MRIDNFISLLFITVFLTPLSLFATDCDVSVRVVKGAVNDSEFKGKEMRVGKFISDMKNQLETLPYKEYTVLDSQKKLVAFGGKGAFTLADASKKIHSLSVSPLKKAEKRVTVMVDWKDPVGDTLVSTQLKVLNGENVVLGTDTSGDESTIMCITVDCP